VVLPSVVFVVVAIVAFFVSRLSFFSVVVAVFVTNSLISSPPWGMYFTIVFFCQLFMYVCVFQCDASLRASDVRESFEWLTMHVM